jgi:hypothetical protein
MAGGASPKITRRLQRQVQNLVLVTVLAVRQSTASST